MAEEVDRRGFMRLLRGGRSTDDSAEEEPERELTPREQELAEFTARLLADVASEDEESLAEGPLLTRVRDDAYMRVTAGHIVYSTATGVSALIKTGDVTTFDTEPPVEVEGQPSYVVGVLRAHHPADLPTVTRSYAFKFPTESPLLAAIRTACGLPEAEPEEAGDDVQEPEAEAPDADGE